MFVLRKLVLKEDLVSGQKVSFLVQNYKICRRDTELSKTNQMELLFKAFAKSAYNRVFE